MASQLDEIFVRKIRAYGYHGVFEKENREGQWFFVDLKMRLPLAAAAATDSADGEAPAEGETPAAPAADPNDPGNMLLGFSVSNQSLFDSIKQLCKAANLHFKAERYAVVVAPMDVPLENMETKLFPFEQSALNGVPGNGADPEALKAFFRDREVEFPAGSKIMYEPRISRLICSNTPENLRKLDEVVSEILNNQQPLVEIHLRVVEISQDDLKELSFSTGLSTTSGTVGDITTTNQLRTGNQNVTGVIKFGEFTLNAAIAAINNLSSKDVLASPRVTTMPEVPVEIRMTRDYYFVEDYDEGESNINTIDNSTSIGGGVASSRYSTIGPFPNFESDPEPIGIIFPVTPRVNFNQRTITMQLNPSISALVGWTEFSGLTEDGGEELVRSPIIATRSINTEVTVNDGETIVMGGIIKDEVQQINDKVPFLGDIPFLGRFFQSKSTKSTKQNMLVFVTTRLVKPDGTPFFPDSSATSETIDRGIPRFY